MGSVRLPGGSPDHRAWRRSLLVGAHTLFVGAIASAVGFATVSLVSASGSRIRAAGDLAVSAVESPASTQLLFPHGAGDVVVTITNPNSFTVTITQVRLPPATEFAAGYATAALRTPVAACGPSPAGSDVTWRSSAEAGTSSHAFASPLIVAARGAEGDPLTVTLVAAAVMGTAASPACEGIYFKMPSIAGLTASDSGKARAPSPAATDEWGN
jgi:hypothetical protein